MSLLLRYAHHFDRRRAPLVVFLGNEYDLLDEKIGFIRERRGRVRVQPAPD